ncbi:MAG: glycosyltransferase family 8 protein [Candidatus Dormibacteria bacterium]
MACAVDEAYVPHVAALAHSLLAQRRGNQLVLHLLHGSDLGWRSRRRLKRMVEGAGATLATHRLPESAVAGLPLFGHISRTMWYRLQLPDLLPEVNRVLYLDADVIAMDDPAPLFTLDLDSFYLAAVDNVFERERMTRPAELGLPAGQRYFNSGVLLMNLAAMRADGCSQALLSCARERAADLLWPDQDVLNLVLGGRRLPLPPRWNVMNAMLDFDWAGEYFDAAALDDARRHPALRHFEGPGVCKPWHPDCIAPHRAAYLEHLAATPWGGRVRA